MQVPFRFLRDRALWRFLGRRFKVAMTLAIVASILSGVVEYVFALFLQVFLSSMGLLGDMAPQLSIPGLEQPIYVGLALGALGLVRALFLFAREFCAGVANEQASQAVREAAISQLIPSDDKNRASFAEAMFNYTELSSKSSQYLLQFVRFVSSAPQTLIIGVAMLFMSWSDTLVAAVLLLASGVLLLRINVRIGESARQIPTVWSKSIAALEVAGRNWFYIRIKHLHTSERHRLQRLNNEVFALGLRMRWLPEIGPALVAFVGVALIAVLVNVRASFTHTAPFVFLSFLYMFMRFAQSVGDSARSASGLIEFGGYLERLRGSIPMLPPRGAGDPSGANVSTWGRDGTPSESTKTAGPVVRPAGLASPRVALRDLSFRYQDDRPWLFRHLNAEVSAGQQLAIVGPSGVGKSTLLGLLLGFNKPVEGSIELDGTAPEQFCERFSEYIGYVGPEPYIITGTIRDNVLFGTRGYNDDQIWRALEQAALADVVRALPGGLDTPIKYHDIALSMGQRQRLALARALVTQPVMLILDEASANLDDATEEAITASIGALKGSTTTIIVSHKLGIVKHADQLIDLGKLAIKTD